MRAHGSPGELEARRPPRGFRLSLDRYRPQRAMRVRTWLATRRRIVLEWLLAYTRELNPAEQVWGHTRYSNPANFALADLDHLGGAVATSSVRTRGDCYLPESFFRGAGLEL